MKKEDFDRLQVLILSNIAMLSALVADMNEKGLIDMDNVMKIHVEDLEEAVKALVK